jgi:hypothetical protein
LKCIENFTGCPIFGNRNIQLQVCSPGRLDPRRSALLAIGFYLGSDTLRRYSIRDLETTVSKSRHHERGQRLVIYDARGEFDRHFEWWDRTPINRRRIRRQLPFEFGRSDLLAGSGSRHDIENINLLATLLIHAQHQGYWGRLGEQFEEDMQTLLDRHLLSGLVNAPWVRTDDPETADDTQFFSALNELVAYAFDESVRVKKKSSNLFSRWKRAPEESTPGILHEMQALLTTYRADVLTQSRLRAKGGRI